MVVDRSNAEHYVWGGSCDGWRHLSRQDLSVIEERVPPGGAEVPHLHERARQLFYVLSGALVLRLGAREHAVAAGQSLEVPPGVPHAVSNRGTVDAWFLVVSSPATRGDRIEL